MWSSCIVELADIIASFRHQRHVTKQIEFDLSCTGRRRTSGERMRIVAELGAATKRPSESTRARATPVPATSSPALLQHATRCLRLERAIDAAESIAMMWVGDRPPLSLVVRRDGSR